MWIISFEKLKKKWNKDIILNFKVTQHEHEAKKT